MDKTRNHAGFAYGVYALILIYLIMGCFMGDSAFGNARWTLPFRANISLVENAVYFLNYSPKFWPLFMAVAIASALLCVLGAMLYLTRLLLFGSTLLLYFLVYSEVDSSVTFLFYGQLLLFVHIPERIRQTKASRALWRQRWIDTWHSIGVHVIPIGVTIFYVVWFVAMLINGGQANGLIVNEMLLFQGDEALGGFFNVTTSYVLLFSHLAVPICIWLKKGTRILTLMGLLGVVIYCLVLGMITSGLLLGLGLLLAKRR